MTWIRYEFDLDLNKECSNFKSNYESSNVFIVSSDKDVYIFNRGEDGIFFFFLSPKIFSGLSTGFVGLGSGFFLVYFLLDGAKISQWSHTFKINQWSHEGQ